MKIVKFKDLELNKIYSKDGRFFRIVQVEDAASPRKDGWYATKFLTWETDYDSPDENPDTFHEFARKTGVEMKGIISIERVVNKLKENGYIALPVYALYHGGVHYSVQDFHDEWDSCPVGIIYCLKHSLSIDDSMEEQSLEEEVEEYDAWANGQTCRIEILDEHANIIDASPEYIVADRNWNSHFVMMMADVGISIRPQDEIRETKVETTITLK